MLDSTCRQLFSEPIRSIQKSLCFLASCPVYQEFKQLFVVCSLPLKVQFLLLFITETYWWGFYLEKSSHTSFHEHVRTASDPLWGPLPGLPWPLLLNLCPGLYALASASHWMWVTWGRPGPWTRRLSTAEGCLLGQWDGSFPEGDPNLQNHAGLLSDLYPLAKVSFPLRDGIFLVLCFVFCSLPSLPHSMSNGHLPKVHWTTPKRSEPLWGIQGSHEYLSHFYSCSFALSLCCTLSPFLPSTVIEFWFLEG